MHVTVGRPRPRPVLSLLLALLVTALLVPAGTAAAAGAAPSSVSVPVRVTAATDPGDTVLLSGSVAELGAWDPAEAVPLTTDGGGSSLWSATVPLPAGSQVQYTYLRRTGAGELVREDVPVRSVFVSANGHLALDDQWNVADGNPVTTVFNAEATTWYGQQLLVSGSLPELGAWDPAKAVPLSTSAFVYPQWTGFATLPPDTALRYKYLTRDPDGTVTWESGPDRSTTTPPSGGTLIVHDTWR
ncbi:carbohydrate-binding module family 20 domain-containing protein [Kitasatospora paranensis]|uniref:alpha-amylase n=1 Tax=Kitasatospora paranensis TaxID=258053 RepID=A0ABW2FQY8_9ACTN